VYDAFRWPNLVIRCLTGCEVVSSFTWCGECRQIMVGLSSMIDCLFFSFFSLSWQLKYIIILFVCCLSNQTWLLDPSGLGLATLCKYTMDQDTVYCRLAQWIFQALKAWDWANVVFLQKVTLIFCSLVEKIKDLIVGVFQYFCSFTLFFV